MRFDRATIALEPMTLTNCLDLSLLFLRAHARPIVQGWLATCGVTCLAMYVSIDRGRGNLLWGVAFLAIGSAVFGAYLTAGTALAAFGEPFTFESAWNRVLADRGRLLRQALGLRMLDVAFLVAAWAIFLPFEQSVPLRILQVLTVLVCLLPTIGVTVRYGFTLEQRVIGRNEKNSSDHQVSEIVRNSLLDLILKFIGLAFAATALWGALAIGIDQLISVLFQQSLLLGRIFDVNTNYIDESEGVWGKRFEFLWEDPGIITYVLAVALVVYPLVRLAWFFCYIDLRVRQDCWDIELQIQQEAERLEGRIST